MPIVTNSSTQRPTKPVPDDETPLLWRDGGDVALLKAEAVVVRVTNIVPVVVADALAVLGVAEMEVVVR